MLAIAPSSPLATSKKTKLPACTLLLITLLIQITQTGCQVFGRFRTHPAANAPIVFSEAPTKQDLIAHLSAQASKIQQLQTDVRVSIDGLPNLRGNLVVERPNRLRLNAGLLGVTELGVDVGSNDEVFWFWAKAAAPGAEPGIYYANHDEYRNSALQNSVPIEPSWLIDALGFLKIEDGDRVEGPFPRPQDGRLELHTYRTTGGQQTLRKTTIDPKYGWISQQAIYDGSGRLLAYANSNKYQHYAEHNVNLPSQIKITAYDPDGSQLSLTVDASRFKINSIYGDPNQLWAMPNPGDVPVVNIVHGVRPEQRSSSALADETSPRIRGHRTSSSAGLRNRTFFKNIR